MERVVGSALHDVVPGPGGLWTGMAQRAYHMATRSCGKGILMIPQRQQREITRQKYYTAVALVLMVVVISATYWMVG